ncbi:MAG: hypothetical protein ACQETI_04200 [Halobacteriota archaeon]
MGGKWRVRLSEIDAMERGVRCPNCGKYNSFGDIIATGHCRGAYHDSGSCTARLALDLVIDPE